MKRFTLRPREGWQARVEHSGLLHHTAAEVPYWAEDRYYSFSMREVMELEQATNELHARCLDAVQHVVEQRRYADFAITPAMVPAIEASWEQDAPSLYGRFDLSYTPGRAPKLLEYNADTPTSLLEAAVAQWHWLEDRFPAADQFNSIHERLIASWAHLRPYLAGEVLHFTSVEETEDLVTVGYLRDTAEQAGLKTEWLHIARIGHPGGRGSFVDEHERPIASIFKLYPWEWMMHEAFGPLIATTPTQWIEPAWKMILSNKMILVVLWELFPGHPNLLPAYREEYLIEDRVEYVRKPLLSREGANITVVGLKERAQTRGDYGAEGFVYQEYAPLPDFGGQRPVIGSWVIGGEAAGMGIRESAGPVTDNLSRFVPHLID